MRMNLRVLAMVASCGLAACGGEVEESAPAAVEELKTDGQFLHSQDAIPGRYIVVLKRTGPEAPDMAVAEAAQSLAARHGLSVERTYQHALRGFVAQGSEAQARALARNPQVAYVVEDGVAQAAATQPSAPWNLDRIDQRSSRDGSYTYDATGSGVHAYIIDTGIRTTHPDFGGRATGDFTAINDGWGADDCHGHGTHVAVTVGGATGGVAKNVRLHGVRVLDCNGLGSSSGIISGIDWVTGNAVRPAVASVSLTVGANQAVDDAVRWSITNGITYAVAAGNDSTDACGYSPARAPSALTVGATDSDDYRASFSNYGSCVDLFAPGVRIKATYNNGSTTELNGTSFAAAHVAGVVALFLQGNPAASPSRVADYVLGYATSNAVQSPGTGSPNRLLYSRLPTTPQRAALHRYFNTGSAHHFYTANWYELGSGGGPWVYEGVTGYVAMGQSWGTTPLYRYHRTDIGDHFYTPNWGELGGGGGLWIYEGVSGYVPTGAGADTTPVYSYFHTGAKDHFYTTNWNELGGGGGGWTYEGVRNYIFTSE